MRSYLRALMLAFVISPLTPDIALCQLPRDDEFEVEEVWVDEPAPKKAPQPRARGIRSSPFVWGVTAVVLAVAIPLGVFKIVCQFRHSQKQQERKLEPWEQAMADAERKRMK